MGMELPALLLPVPKEAQAQVLAQAEVSKGKQQIFDLTLEDYPTHLWRLSVRSSCF